MIGSKRKKTALPPMTGGSSLLIIFAVLCLTIFTLLALSTVQANQRLLHASLSAVTNYYEADWEAEQILADLRKMQSEHGTSQSLPEGVTRTGNIYSYCCPISDTQNLYVEVQCTGSQWTILKWQTGSTVTYEP